jgi:hypothetical protein
MRWRDLIRAFVRWWRARRIQRHASGEIPPRKLKRRAYQADRRRLSFMSLILQAMGVHVKEVAASQRCVDRAARERLVPLLCQLPRRGGKCSPVWTQA